MSKNVLYSVFANKQLVISWLKQILFYPLFLISSIIPKSKIIVYGSMNGFLATDNAKYHYIHSNSEKKIFILKHKPNLIKAQKQNINAIYCFSILGLWYQLVAKEAYWSHGINDFFAPLVAGTKVIGLQHGAPIKKGGTARDVHLSKNYSSYRRKKIKSFLRNLFIRIMPYSHSQYCNQTICGEKKFKPYVESIFEFCKPEILDIMLPRIQFANYVEKQKYILYAPTYRPYRELVDTLRKINFNPKSVHQTIKEHHVKLKLRPHPLDNSPHLKDFLSLESYISIELDDTEDLYSMIRGYSAIITDFSSIYQDAKWLDIPVFTVCDDFDIYDEQSGLFDWYKKEVSEDMYSDFQEVINTAVAIIND